MGAYKRIAAVTATKNLHGGLVVHAATGLPFLLSEGMPVRFVPRRIGRVDAATVRSIEGEGDSRLCFFSGVDDRDTASDLVGCSILVPSELAEVALDEVREGGLEGLVVLAPADGFVGMVREVLTNPAHETVVIAPLPADAAAAVLTAPWVGELQDAFGLAGVDSSADAPADPDFVARMDDELDALRDAVVDADEAGELPSDVLVPWVDEYVAAEDRELGVAFAHVPESLRALNLTRDEREAAAADAGPAESTAFALDPVPNDPDPESQP